MQSGWSALGQIRDTETQLGLRGIRCRRPGIIFRLLTGAGCGNHLGAVADGDGGVKLLAVAHISDPGRRTRLARGDVAYQVVAILYRAAIDRGNNVSWLEAGLVGGEAGLNTADEHSGLEAVNAADSAGQIALEGNAYAAAGDFVLRTDELVVDPDDRIGRHGEANAGIRPGLRINGGIDSDYLAGHVEQRSA